MIVDHNILVSELRLAAEKLRAAGVPDAMADTRILAAAVFGMSREDMLLEPRRPIDLTARDRFHAIIERRRLREPVARILGAREFRSLDFALRPETLEPRPDSEVVVEAAVAFGRAFPGAVRVLDLGTGTGCLLLSVLSELRDGTGVGSDIAAGAIEIATRNAYNLGFSERVKFIQTKWTEGIDCTFDLILSNPPYIMTGDIENLAPEVAAFDPPLALDGGKDGLDAYRALAQCIPEKLSSPGVLVIEIGAGQHDDVTMIFDAGGLSLFGSETDLGGHVRALFFAKEPLPEWLIGAGKKGLETV